MNCNRFQGDIPTLLELGVKELPEEHLRHAEGCDECNAAWSAAAEAWRWIQDDADAIEIPSLEMRSAFEARNWRSSLGRTVPPRSAMSRLRLVPRRVQRVAAVVLLLAAGFAIGRIADSTRSSASGEDVARLQGRLVRTQLQLPAPTARLEAIYITETMQELDDEIVQALLNAVRNDPNINVRLAAIDALSRFVADGHVRRGLEDALPRQKSPLTRTSLSEVLE